MTFLYVLPYVLVYFVEKLYVPIRSVQQYLHFASFLRHAFFSPSGPLSSQGTCYAVPIRAVYVPIRAVSPNHFGICLWPAGAPRQTPVRSYTFCATVSVSCCNHVLKLYVPIRSVQPSRNYVKRLYVPIRSYSVPIRSSICFSIFCWKVIRSYTFRATLSLFCEIGIRSYTFLLRSYTFFHMFLNILLKRYTFLYVPCDSVANTRNVPDFCPQSTF